jgi:putative MATE family efflux protein
MSPNADLDRLREGPVLSTLLRLATPNMLAMAMWVLVGITETFYVGRLGTTPLAAIALVFPFSILTGMMSAGAMGGGVSSAIARALGASDQQRAHTLAMHALLIGLVAGLVYSLFFVALGPSFYRALGGHDDILEQAVGYSSVLFSGAVLVWLTNTMASVIRGTGNMRVPSIGIFGSAVLQIVLGGVLSLGIGPIPSLGMPGIAIGHIIATACGVAFFSWYLATGKGRLRLRPHRFAIRRNMLSDILKVGAIACLSPIQTVLTMQIFASLIAPLGVLALAGYSIGQRLEYLVTPFAFSIGVASVPMIGMAIGAGQVARARKVAWSAGLVSFAVLGLTGLVVLIVPDLWAGIYSSDEGVLEYARQYLRIVGPAFALLGLGTTLYFSSQGAGKVLGLVIAGTVRLVVAFAGGIWLASQQAPAWNYFALVAIAMSSYGLAAAGSVHWTRWTPPKRG